MALNSAGKDNAVMSCGAAEALDVSVAELLDSEPNSKRGKPGPTPQLQLRFDQISRLPRKEQEFVISATKARRHYRTFHRSSRWQIIHRCNLSYQDA